jgi:ribosomal protein S18 acetylase RimI-like enzyme
MIREASSSDSSRIKEIIILSFPWFFRIFAKQSVESKEGKVLVAETDSQVEGFAKLIDFQIGVTKYGCILWIAVHPLYRRKGIALRLTQEGLDYLKKQSSRAVFASTQRGNKAAKATLGKAGFAKIGLLGLRALFSWRVISFFGSIWYTPFEIVYIHD